jgi:hypothetical protein
MNTRIEMSIFAVGAGLILAGCITEPPSLPPHNAADPQVHGSSKARRNVLTPDETTVAIRKQLSATQGQAPDAEKMEHDMSNMPGMEHGKMDDHEQYQPSPNDTEAQKKKLADEMKKTADEMKATSDAMKKKSKEIKKEPKHEDH